MKCGKKIWKERRRKKNMPGYIDMWKGDINILWVNI